MDDFLAHTISISSKLVLVQNLLGSVCNRCSIAAATFAVAATLVATTLALSRLPALLRIIRVPDDAILLAA